MPQILEINGVPTTVATEQELLEFVNKARRAGGANVLEALLPSKPYISEECLIAVGLNFSCMVDALQRNFELEDPASGKLIAQWGMHLPENMPAAQARDIATALGAALHAINWEDAIVEAKPDEAYYRFVIPLPLEIGNAALAFDAGAAFTEYRDL